MYINMNKYQEALNIAILHEDGSITNRCTGKKSYGNKLESGYMRFCIRNKGKAMYCLVHVLIALKYVCGYVKGYQVNHIDGDKQNNQVSNLEWVSRSQNQRHAVINRLQPTKTNISLKTGNKVAQYDITGKLISVYDSLCDVAKKTQFHKGNVCSCISGRLKTYKGFIWQYID